jgi:hypothetical protein
MSEANVGPVSMETANITPETMRVDDEGVRYISFRVSIALASKLDDQRQRLDKVSAEASGKARYIDARSKGCFASVAKGCKDRVLEPNQIFIPGSELQNGNGTVRISALKAEMPVPAGVHVKNVTFMRDPSIPSEIAVAWSGALEVTEEK